MLKKLFHIQGKQWDFDDPQKSCDSITVALDRVRSGSKGLPWMYKYDVFISYRQASERHLADCLYDVLTRARKRVFLDIKCLDNGFDWQQAFLEGLQTAMLYVPLISEAALARMRKPDADSWDHSSDNLLLEFETALEIMSTTANARFICPIFVEDVSRFNLDLYNDIICQKKIDVQKNLDN